MKFKIFGLVMTAVMLLVCFSFSYSPLNTDENNQRYHQHKEAAAYTPCTDHNDDVFCSHLPLVVIDTENQEIPGVPNGEVDQFGEPIYTTALDGNDYINVKVSVIDNDIESKGNNHLTDKPDFTTRSLFRIRGHASRNFEKSPYLLDFVDSNGENRDISVMGMDAHHEWVLNGPYLDKSMVRNYMWYNISGEIMDYAPNVRFCEVFINGDYRGLYIMVEAITDGENCRLNLSENVKDNEINGFLLRLDRPTEAELESIRDIYSYMERTDSLHTDVSIRYPKKPNLTEERRKNIELEYAKFEKALFSYDYDTEDYGYWNWIDTDNFVDYLLINEFTRNADAGRYSTYIYREIDEKYKLCVWDFNNACDNFPEDVISYDGLSIYSMTWYFMLIKDEEFVDKVLKRYKELRSTYFNDDYLFEYIDDTLDYLGPAVERNNKRWAASFTEWQPLVPKERNLKTHEEAVDQLKTWLHERGEWLDENIHTLNQYCHPSRNKNYNH